MAITAYFIDKHWRYREILLSFEPLEGTHSGANLSIVLMELLQKHNIVDRVLAVTTDNASNNNTLIESLHESIQSLNLPSQTAIVRIPCLAHVIQLSLQSLLGQIKANPKNDNADRVWSESHIENLRNSRRKQGIIYTLAKVSIKLALKLPFSAFN